LRLVCILAIQTRTFIAADDDDDDDDDIGTRSVLGTILIGAFVLRYVGSMVVCRKSMLHKNDEHKQAAQLASVDEEQGVASASVFIVRE